jgi:drug/metabolite transporter (DMT)-like permease
MAQQPIAADADVISIPDAPAAPAIPVQQPAFGLTRLDFGLIIAMMLWGGNFVVSKAATDVIPPMPYNALRFTVATLTMFVLLRFMRVNLYVPRREWWPIVLASIIGNTLYQPLFMNGLHETSASNAVLIITAGPIWVVIFNALRSQERITRGAMLGVALAVGGVLAVIIGRYAGKLGFTETTLHGDLLMVGASVMWAASILVSKRPLANNPHLVATFWTLFCGMVSSVIMGAPGLAAYDWSRFNTSALFGVIYSGGISIAFGSIVFNYAVHKLGATRTSLYTYLQPLVAASLAVVVLGEPFTLMLVIGGVLIFIGVGLARRL